MRVLGTLASALLAASAAATCDPSKWKPPSDGVYNTSSRVDPNKLNVHLIAHSHDDPGWLISVDQYYTQRVQYILDTAVEELVRNPDRQFMYVEQSFFQRWWHQQGSEVRGIVKQLVREGRLDLTVNGGWCMHDEATPHYIAMVDQTAYGHQLLMDEFGISPRIGWQIDPFGHSATQGSLLSQGVGFDALYFARIDYQDYGNRKKNKDLEFIWRPSKSRGKASQVFTGEIIDHYCPPGKFDFGNNGNQIQDDPELHDYDVCDEVEQFVSNAKMRGDHSKGNHVFIPMGCDFQYDNSLRWFKNMDKILHYVNQDGRVNVLYSNLSYYTDVKREEGLTWSVKTDDFFPYGSAQDDYWSGFFTSRPTLKRFARVANTLLQQVRQIDAVYQSHHSSPLVALQRAVGLVQHHDGVSGTEKQSVADDYSLRLNDGIIKAEKELNEVLFVIGDKEPYHLCLLANTSVCDVSTQNSNFEVLVHNALARTSVQTFSIPITHKSAEVTLLSGNAKVREQNVYVALPVHPEVQVAPYSFVFSAELKPLSTTRFTVKQKDIEAEEIVTDSLDATDDVIVLENHLMRAEISKTTGSITKLANKKKNIQIPLSLDVAYYQAFQAGGPKSGAYVFRPNSNKTYPVAGKENSLLDVEMVELHTAANGGLASVPRVAFKIGSWVTLEYRVNDNDEFLEIEWTVGPVPIDDKTGKEVILRFDAGKSIASDATLYTDSNGLEFMKRVRNHRDTWNLTLHDNQEAVAANYFPITTGAYIKDETHQLNVVTDRAQGAASLVDGQVEVMVHRRLLADDNKGVSEHLNETESVYDSATKKQVTKGLVVRGNFFVNVDSAEDGMRSIRSKMEAQFFRPLTIFRKPVPSEVEAKVPWLTVNDFPENVGLTTLQELTKQCLMVRLSHLYAVDEHSTLSKPVTVDFSTLFSVKNAAVSEVKELVLTGTKELAEQQEGTGMQWKTTDDAYGWTPRSLPVKGTSVTLQAIEVRAFRVCFAKSAAAAVDGPEEDGYSESLDAVLQDLAEVIAFE
ncbi:Glycosyl hydrolases family 38 C-terminal domain [Phytophthora infestans]|uniref:Alpha-mannosidase n=1 Tax=Phytophthora infestans TaxID=4787 RepID=A0A833SU37_PHYIN|nr:Glycosyl hydrolases family 38 C-terminal domain [Phytophthora infestans]KAF4145141.1 Glycosyl hydrolases family 38 C-terminal domain [Phytophthora infestans]